MIMPFLEQAVKQTRVWGVLKIIWMCIFNVNFTTGCFQHCEPLCGCCVVTLNNWNGRIQQSLARLLLSLIAWGSVMSSCQVVINFHGYQSRAWHHVWMAGDVRNDLYVTLAEGEFERGNKKSARNVEVSFKVVSKSGRVVDNCIYFGTGAKPVTEYRSIILRHSNHPMWNETVKVSLPFDTFHDYHLRFTFRHCSTRSEGSIDRMYFVVLGFQLNLFFIVAQCRKRWQTSFCICSSSGCGWNYPEGWQAWTLHLQGTSRQNCRLRVVRQKVNNTQLFI